MIDVDAPRVLVGCEFSGTVRDAFTAAGCEAWSCDMLPSETLGLHYQGDVRHLLQGWVPVRYTGECDPEGDGACAVSGLDTSLCGCYGPTQDGIEYKEDHGILWGRPIDRPQWDLAIFHPPCTYLASSGLHWNTRRPERAALTEEAVQFVLTLNGANAKRVAIENPIGALSSRWRKPDCITHPWHHGDDASKATCFWLTNLPPLTPTNELPGGRTARRANQTASGQNKLGPSPDRWKLRSATYPGIATAMVTHWRPLL